MSNSRAKESNEVAATADKVKVANETDGFGFPNSPEGDFNRRMHALKCGSVGWLIGIICAYIALGVGCLIGNTLND